MIKLTCRIFPLVVAAVLLAGGSAWAEPPSAEAIDFSMNTADTGAPNVHSSSAEAPAPSGQMGLLIFVFVLAIFLGLELIGKVPSQLHTPLMSGSNAISGITIVGALVAVKSGNGTITLILGTLAVALAMINVVGGYAVTDRMLLMFTKKKGGAK